MGQPTPTDKEIMTLKKKLDSAIRARLELQKDLETQSSTFVQFINKLSQTAKGIDVQLDNKLATLRKTLSKSSSWEEVEVMIIEISQLLQKHSIKNDQNIANLHEQFHHAGQVLQQIKNLPDSLRRNLRTLINETKERKDSVVQYVPPLSQLIEFYHVALKSKDNQPKGGLLNNSTSNKTQVPDIDIKLIERFSLFLSHLNISSVYKPQINKIRANLSTQISHQDLVNDFLEVFEIINKDLIQERNTAKVFLSTLSATLSSVKTAVQSTLIANVVSKEKHTKLSLKLNKNISEMAKDLDNANSLAEIKIDINEKLKQIATSLEEKTSFELTQFNEMSRRLNEMKDKVNTLELQGRMFEKRMQEQQARSYQDPLTKLGNRASFDDYFAKKIVRFHNSSFELAIVVLDLDNFKRINDSYGHTAGDKTLQVIANILAKSITNEEFVGRYGGEEFVMIFSNFNKESLLDKLNEIRLKVAKLPFKFKNNNVSITLSIGVTHITNDDNVHLAFERADIALYQAKKNGKDQVIYA